MTTTAPGNRLGGAAAEPSNALRALLELPLRHQVAPEANEAIAALQQSIRQTAPDGEWITHYTRSIEIVDMVVRTTDARMEEMQRKALAMEDPNEAKQRLATAPRREAERVRTDAKAAAQRVAKEWVERSKRQVEHVTGQCIEAAQTLLVTKEEPVETGIVLRIDPPSLAQFAGYVSRCAEEWTKNAVGGVEKSLSDAVMGVTANLSVQGNRGPATPRTTDSPANEAKIAGEPPVKQEEVPSTGAALMNSGLDFAFIDLSKRRGRPFGHTKVARLILTKSIKC